MIGQQHVIDMRMDRLKPLAVFVWTDHTPPSWWEANPHTFELYPHVFIEPGERIERLDMRWAVGLHVHIGALTLPRLAEVTHACKQAGARRITQALFDEKGVTFHCDSETRQTWRRPKT